MAVISEITELLRRWDVWKKVEASPDRLDALERRVADLEAKIVSRPAPESCPMCERGELKVVNVRPHSTFGYAGVQTRQMKCAACGHTEEREHNPSAALR